MIKRIFCVFTLFFYIKVIAVNNSTDKLKTSVCYDLKDETSCNKNNSCSWCNVAGYDDVYSCYDSIDDCDCVKQSDYDACVQLTKCHYCNLGAYAGRYCISNDVECG